MDFGSRSASKRRRYAEAADDRDTPQSSASQSWRNNNARFTVPGTEGQQPYSSNTHQERDEAQAQMQGLVENDSSLEAKTKSKTLNYLLFKHGIELGVPGWLALVFTILGFAWTVMSLNTNSAIARMALTQQALANQVSFIKLCLDYPQLRVAGTGVNSTEGLSQSTLATQGLRSLLRSDPCSTFLGALDGAAMARILVDPSMVPDIKPPKSPSDLGRLEPGSGLFEDKDESFLAYLKVGAEVLRSLFSWATLKGLAAMLIWFIGLMFAALLVLFLISISVGVIVTVVSVCRKRSSMTREERRNQSTVEMLRTEWAKFF